MHTRWRTLSWVLPVILLTSSDSWANDTQSPSAGVQVNPPAQPNITNGAQPKASAGTQSSRANLSAPADNATDHGKTAQPPVQSPSSTSTPQAVPSPPVPEPASQPVDPSATNAPIGAAAQPVEAIPSAPPVEPVAPAPATQLELEPSFEEKQLPPPPSMEGVQITDAQIYDLRFRPKDNPGRVLISVHTGAAIYGGKNSVTQGRMATIIGDAGVTWNNVGVAMTMSGAFGLVLLDAGNAYQVNSLYGIGPSLTLGRTGYVRNSFIDVRAGYDFHYGATSQAVLPVNREDSAIAPELIPSAVTPHGPRIDFDIGLFSVNAGPRWLRHGVGITLGYKRILGSFSGAFAPGGQGTVALTYRYG